MAMFNRSALEANTQAAVVGKEMPKSQYWLNIGYEVEVPNEDGELVNTFVSLPFGLPLDNMEPVKTGSKNQRYAALQQAKNALLDALLAHAKEMPAGSEEIIDLKIQLRRVNGEAEVSISNGENPFVKKIF